MPAILLPWLAFGLLLGGLGTAPAQQQKRITAKKIAPKKIKARGAKSSIKKAAPAKSSIKKPSAPKSAIAKKAGKLPARRRYSSNINRARKAPARRGQLAPAPDRIKEIQAALRERGYFNEEPDGKWGESSVAAMKRFQEEQNLKPDGKIGALSLIALGLGPRRGGAPPAAPAQAPGGGEAGRERQ
jgi:peptidoglycan hydrolase-like protein with peptidoglycan-binding domain